jgi:multidrug efflux system membrane fusion protein
MKPDMEPPDPGTLGDQVQLPGQNAAASRPPKKRGLIWLLFLLAIGAVAGYAVYVASKPAPVPQNAGGGGGRRGGGNGPVPVVVSTVTRSSIPVYLNGLGNVTAFYTVTVKSRVDGQLMKVLFNEGDLVKKDQTLAQLDPRPFQVALDQVQSQLGHDQAQLAQAQANLARDVASQIYAKNEADRYARLVEQGIVAKDQGEQLRSSADALNGTVKADQAAIDSATAQIKTDRSAIDSAQLQLTYSEVTAPITGVAGLRIVDPGNIVHASDQNGLVVITQLQPITVLFTIPEDNLPQITKELRAGVHLPVDAYNRDNSKKLASGKLVTVDNQIDSTTGTSKLKAVFDNTDNALFPQQFVNIRLLVDTLANQIVIPNVAVQNGQNGTFVYVVDSDSKVHVKPVQVGVTTETSSAILTGLTDGDRVVVDGTDRLVEDAVVRVRKAGELENPPDYNPPDTGGGGGAKGKGGGRKGKGKKGGGGQ